MKTVFCLQFTVAHTWMDYSWKAVAKRWRELGEKKEK